MENGWLKLAYILFHQTNRHSNLYIGCDLQDQKWKSVFDWSAGCVLAGVAANVAWLWVLLDPIRRNVGFIGSAMITKFCELFWSFNIGLQKPDERRGCDLWPRVLNQHPSRQKLPRILAHNHVRGGNGAASLICGLKNNLIFQLPETSRLKNNLFPKLQRVRDYICSIFHPFLECRLWHLLTFVLIRFLFFLLNYDYFISLKWSSH